MAEELLPQVGEDPLADPAGHVRLDVGHAPVRQPGERRRATTTSTSCVPVVAVDRVVERVLREEGRGERGRGRGQEREDGEEGAQAVRASSSRQSRPSRRRVVLHDQSSTSAPRARVRDPPGWWTLTPLPPRRRAPRRRRRTAARAGRGRGSRGRRCSSRAARRACRAPQIRPPSSTTISSASAIVERRWAMISVVRPLITSRRPGADAGLRRRVDRGGGVVEDQDARVDREGARDRDSLPLAARERDAALADHRVVALGQALDELVRLREPRDALDLGVGQLRQAERDVVPHRGGEEERILRDDADLAAQ